MQKNDFILFYFIKSFLDLQFNMYEPTTLSAIIDEYHIPSDIEISDVSDTQFKRYFHCTLKTKNFVYMFGVENELFKHELLLKTFLNCVNSSNILPNHIFTCVTGIPMEIKDNMIMIKGNTEYFGEIDIRCIKIIDDLKITNIKCYHEKLVCSVTEPFCYKIIFTKDTIELINTEDVTKNSFNCCECGYNDEHHVITTSYDKDIIKFLDIYYDYNLLSFINTNVHVQRAH